MNTLLIIGAIMIAGIIFYCWDWVKKNPKKTGAIAIGTGILLAQASQPINTSFQDLPNVAKEQGLYRITFDEYSDVEIKDQNTPEVKLRKWGDETYIKLSYPDFSPVNPKQDKGKLKWVNGDKEVHLYPTKVGEIDAFEFDITLKEKPTTNKIVLDLELHNVVAYYQPPLDEEMKGQNCWTESCTPTDCCDSHRPENIVGSYVFYHATKGNIHPVGEAKKYKTSQIGVLYRPKIIDAVGNWAWSEQEIIIDEKGKGQQIITISQQFLDNAVYPIRHAGGDTFGYETQGTNQFDIASSGAWYARGLHSTLTEDGDVTSLTAYISQADETANFKGAIFNHTGAWDKQDETVDTTNASTGWITRNFSAPVSLLADEYWLIVVADGDDLSSGKVHRIAFNTGAPANTGCKDILASFVFTDPLECDSLYSYYFSVYATYSTEAPPARRFMDVE